MRPIGRPFVALLAATVLVPGFAGAAPQKRPVDDRLKEARAARAEALATAEAAAERLASLRARYEELEAQAERAAALMLDAAFREASLRARLARARSLVNARANAAYRAGPGVFLDALLESRSLGEVLSSQEIIEQALMADIEDAARALEERDAARALRAGLERAKSQLVAQQRELGALQAEMASVLAEARAAARAAGVKVQALEEEKERLEQAAAREVERTALLRVGVDQSDLLALLGPDGGRGCDIPSGLERTGDSFTGQASFYGDEFAGQPTATGAAFVPELFTAAHRTLPLPSFLHVTYRGRCATVLVNDRGPYVAGRVLDLSEGAARYLGLPGVDVVTADILSVR
ncbi:MAG TPA: RlpA-like double-psi beta-barrel domain-containing protein [Actinomycetota bacterium]|nr:RlpA-like double-psi beta-barrel domain-containing protein [Actinomycetota bacterium]